MKKNITYVFLVIILFLTSSVHAAVVDLNIPGGGDANLFPGSSPSPINNVSDLQTVNNVSPVNLNTSNSVDLFGDVPSDTGPILGTTAEILSNSASQSAAPSKMSIAGLVNWLVGLLNYIVRLIVLLALIAFLYGILKLVFVDASNETERAKARKFMLWGIVSLFVMVSVWGLVNVLKSTVFGEGALIVPQLK